MIKLEKITIISVGNGGYNIASDIINAGYIQDIQLVVCDSVETNLQRNLENVARTFLLDFSQKNTYLTETITYTDILEDTPDIIIISVSFGGRTGSYHAPLIVLEAVLFGKTVYTLCSMPFSFEGEKRMIKAKNARALMSVSSKLMVSQNNETMRGLGLNMGEMNKPIVSPKVCKSLLFSCMQNYK
ncbi:MAG: hypothetical protein KH111_13925 [Bacteroidales bacterium]|nr:hypothetical protein [Bacteroidales bacterium]